MKRPIYGLVLAAGGSTRLGRSKQLLDLDGKPLVAAVAGRLKEAGVDRVAVVTGAGAEEVRAALLRNAVEIVLNARWRDGIGSSFAIGIRHVADADAEAVVIALTDQPRIGVDHYRELIGRYRISGRPVATGYPDRSRGVPALFPRDAFIDLSNCSGDSGAKAILAAYGDRVETVANDDAVFDIDLPEDVPG